MYFIIRNTKTIENKFYTVKIFLEFRIFINLLIESKAG